MNWKIHRHNNLAAGEKFKFLGELCFETSGRITSISRPAKNSNIDRNSPLYSASCELKALAFPGLQLNSACAWSRLKERDQQQRFCDWTCRWFYINFTTDFFFFIPSLTLISSAHYCVVCSFPALHSDVTKMSLASQIEHQEAFTLNFVHRPREKCKCIACNHFQ